METTFEEIFDAPADPFSMSQDELIQRFRCLDEQIKRLADERRGIQSQLAALAFDERNGQNTVHLTSTDGHKVKVVFGDDVTYDEELLKDVRNLLGDERFKELFSEKVEYVPAKRPLKMFMNTVAPDERTRSAKEILQQAQISKPKTPYVSVEN